MANRRDFLLKGTGLAAALMCGHKAFAIDLGVDGQNLPAISPALSFGIPSAFSFEALAQAASLKSKTPYVEKINSNTAILEKLGYDELGQIRYKPENALFQGEGLYPITFFHMGNYFRNPVKMFMLEEYNQGDNKSLISRELTYTEQYFTIPDNSHAKALNNADMGFAGFKIQEKSGGALPWQTNDWVAFLGASYFRAIGSLSQYGLSARALAIDSGIEYKKEDFPNFTEFYFAPQKEGSPDIVIYAMLEGKSVVGAYKFTLQRGSSVDMQVEAKLFVRETVVRFGIAALTSMYWYSEAAKKPGGDWRPEIHDSDGLSIQTGQGQWLWRQLNNPKKISVSAFGDNNPKGFGLLQRDRNFENYLDGVHYEKRPNLWVEPVSNFGAGSVQLIELPTQDETNDNIVVCWVPEQPVQPGQMLDLQYKLYWGDTEKVSTTGLARCISTRTGFGGQPGQVRKDNLTKFVVEFQGDKLTDVKDKPDIILSSAQGVFSTILWERVPYGKKDRIRIQFDFELQKDVADIELYLKNQDTLLTETWVYQLHK